MADVSRFNNSPSKPSPGAAERLDVSGNRESCIRIDGGASGATVRNDGPCSVENAVAVPADQAYGAITTVAAGASQAVAASAVRDFWAAGSGRSRLIITRP